MLLPYFSYKTAPNDGCGFSFKQTWIPNWVFLFVQLILRIRFLKIIRIYIRSFLKTFHCKNCVSFRWKHSICFSEESDSCAKFGRTVADVWVVIEDVFLKIVNVFCFFFNIFTAKVWWYLDSLRSKMLCAKLGRYRTNFYGDVYLIQIPNFGEI